MTFSLTGIKLGKAHPLSRDKYLPRVMGDLAAFVILFLLVIERGWSHWYFPFLVLSFLVYPHLVLLASKMVPGTKKIEIGAMLIEAFIMGLWIPFANFFLWGTFALHLATVVQNGLVGGYRQIVVSHIPFLGGVLCGGLMTGFVFVPDGPFYIELFTVLFLLVYLIDLGGTFYKKNIRIKEISSSLNRQNFKLNNNIKELHSTKEKLAEKAHKAGMADLATGILHNMGNILNSVNISAEKIAEILRNSKFSSFKKANQLLNEHQDNFEEFILKDSRGKKLLDYYLKLEERLDEEHREIEKYSNRLDDKIHLMIEAIEAQQNYAGSRMEAEDTSLDEMIDNILSLKADSIEQQNLKIKKDIGTTNLVTVQRTKLFNTLINIFEVLKEAILEFHPQDKTIDIKTWQDERNVYLSITANGIDIPNKNIAKILTQDFLAEEKNQEFVLYKYVGYRSGEDRKVEGKSGRTKEGAMFILKFLRLQEK